jgi:hypothetical protein
MHKTRFLALLLLGLLATACKKDDTPTDVQTFNFDFDKGLQGWTVDFSDYNQSNGDLELKGEIAPLPAPLNTAVKALKVQGHNRSDDLFMFIERKLTGLEPKRDYRLKIDVRLASDAPNGAVGIGGAPGESVYLKAGGTSIEPVVTKKANGDYEVNIKKGQQSNSGDDLKVIGNTANGGTKFEYVGIARKAEGQTVKTNEKGECWVVIGTDSGYEGLTTLYYQRVDVRLELVD